MCFESTGTCWTKIFSLGNLVLPCHESFLSLPLSVVPLLIIVIIIFEAVFPGSLSVFGPIVVAAVCVVTVVSTISIPRSRPWSRPAASRASDAEPSDVLCLSESTLSLLVFLLPVSRFREFGSKAIRGKTSVTTVAALSATGASARSAVPRTLTPAAVRAGPIRQRHQYRFERLTSTSGIESRPLNFVKTIYIRHQQTALTIFI